MTCSASDLRDKYGKDFIEPLDVERPDCPWPSKMAWYREDAQKVAQLMRSRGHPDIRAYQCEGCQLWHTGKNWAAFSKRVRTVLSSADHRQRETRKRRKNWKR